MQHTKRTVRFLMHTKIFVTSWKQQPSLQIQFVWQHKKQLRKIVRLIVLGKVHLPPTPTTQSCQKPLSKQTKMQRNSKRPVILLKTFRTR